MENAVEVEGLYKQYRLGLVGTGTLSHDLNRLWAKVTGKEDPYALVGDINDRSSSSASDYVWALQDINFKIKQGEIFGIIGRNGAGKSTLLKILSRITSPTKGTIKMRGRVGSLLEVGTGFHPELTGRENVYLNGAILGMKRREINAKFDDIVGFSGCSKYIDTPVKRYSSGMKVRLGFAVAAFLEPEVLIVDEVLAVGDAEFQKQCVGKMKDVSQSGGRTILFVSHNLDAVERLCSRSIVMDKGRVIYEGSVKDSIVNYLNMSGGEGSLFDLRDKISKMSGNYYIQFLDINVNDKSQFTFSNSENIKIRIKYKIKNAISGLRISIKLFDVNEKQIFRSNFDDGLEMPLVLEEGVYESLCEIPGNFLSDHDYKVQVYAWMYSGEKLGMTPIEIKLNISRGGMVNKAFPGDPLQGIIAPLLKWSTKRDF